MAARGAKAKERRALIIIRLCMSRNSSKRSTGKPHVLRLIEVRRQSVQWLMVELLFFVDEIVKGVVELLCLG